MINGKNFILLYCSILLMLPGSSCSNGSDEVKAKVKPGAKFTDLVTIRKISTTGKQGQITMSHKKHMAKRIKCTTCHHKNKNPKKVKDCISCHLDRKGDDKIMHTLCVNCHKKQKQGPVKCLECHKKK